jgi:hypothetical protein
MLPTISIQTSEERELGQVVGSVSQPTRVESPRKVVTEGEDVR